MAGAAVAPGGRTLAAVLLVGAAWAAWGLVRHPTFQPAHALRIVAPLAALAIGGGYARLVARARSHIDEAREFDRGGKALFMGFAMVAATLVAWVLLSQALPATWTALAGTPRSEPGVVAQRVPEADEPACPHRLVVTSAPAGGGAVARPLDECVQAPVWAAAREGGPVTLRLVGSALGAELVGVAPP